MITLKQILTPESLRKGFDKVRENNGTYGIDNIPVHVFAHNLEEKLSKLIADVKAGAYRCQPCRIVDIPKNTGAFRRLAIPTVRDRVLQTAISQKLVTFFEPHFEKCSFGYRPNRSYLQAVKKIQQYRDEGFTVVVDADIHSYFDHIPQVSLINTLSQYIQDPALLALIESSLKQMQYLKKQPLFGAGENLGLPQGSPMSPVLANLYLDVLDEALLKEDFRLVRYADDFVILCQDASRAARAMSLSRTILDELQLNFHPEKTRLTDFDNGFVFLGHYFIGQLVEPIGNSAGQASRSEWIWDAPLEQGEIEAREFNAKNKSLPSQSRESEHTIGDTAPDSDQTLLQDAIFEAIETRTSIRAVKEEMTDLRLVSRLRTMYIAKQGAVVHKVAGKFVVRHAGEDLSVMPVNQVDSLMLFGAVQLTHGAYHYALQCEIPVIFMSCGGKYHGMLSAPQYPNWELNQRMTNELRIQVAKSLVAAKVSNSATMFKRILRYRTLDEQKALYNGIKALSRIQQHAGVVDSIEKLRGFEGNAARVAFSIMRALIGPEWNFTTRNRRPPADPVNALLSLGYTILFNNMTAMLSARNMPLNTGCLHKGSHKHPALILDMMEPFRAPVVDATVLKLINSRAIAPTDFSFEGIACLIGKKARTLLIESIEARLQSQVEYRTLEIQTDYRRIMDLQGLLFRQFIMGEKSNFAAFRNR